MPEALSRPREGDLRSNESSPSKCLETAHVPHVGQGNDHKGQWSTVSISNMCRGWYHPPSLVFDVWRSIFSMSSLFCSSVK